MRLITYVGIIGAIALLTIGMITIVAYMVWQTDLSRIQSIPQNITIPQNTTLPIVGNITVNTSGFEMCSYALPAISNGRVCRQICQTDNLTGTFTWNKTDKCPMWCVCAKGGD